jgi:hypothetical protein
MMEKKDFDTRIKEALDREDPKEAFACLARLYASATPDQREAIRQGWDFNRAWLLPDSRTLACRLPGAPSCEERIRVSLIYNSIEDFRMDFRDNLVALCAIYHSALAIGLDADALFEEIARLSSTRGADMIRSFAGREPVLKSLEAFGWERVDTADGVIFKGW